MKRKIILITGKKRAGKDTFAKFLTQLLPNNVTTYAFADTLKKVTADTFGITLEELDYAKNKGVVKALFKYKRIVFLNNFRKILQQLGMAARNNISINIWSAQVVNSIMDASPTGEVIDIITDYRLPSEFGAIKNIPNADIITVYIKGTTESNDTHITENSVTAEMCDVVIDNRSTLRNLRTEAWSFVIDHIHTGG